MPTISRANVAAGTANDVDGLQFQDIPAGGALVSLYGSTAAAGGNFDYTVGTERFLVAGIANVEIAADVVQNDRDMILDREPVPEGKQFLAVNAQICNYRLVMEYTPAVG